MAGPFRSDGPLQPSVLEQHAQPACSALHAPLHAPLHPSHQAAAAIAANAAMPNVTENAILPLRPGVDLESPDSPDAQAWRNTLAVLAAQPGCVRLATGRQVENPDVMQMLIEWTSLEDHATFMAAPAYAPFLAAVKALMAPEAAPTLTHHTLSTHASSPSSSSSSSPSAPVTASPVTELVSLYFPAAYAPAAFDAPLQRFAAAAAAHARGLRSLAHGWSVELDVAHAAASATGRLCLLLVGWDSVDAHLAYRQTDAFRDTIGALRAEASAVEMHHVIFEEYRG